MSYKNTQDKLRDLAKYIAEPIPPRLGEKIRENIPERLHQHWGKDAVNIIIHLRISRRTAFITILITLVLCFFLFKGIIPSDNAFTADLSRLLQMWPKSTLDLKVFEGYYEKLVADGYEAVYLGDIAEPENPTDIVLYYRLDDDRYRVIFADIRAPIVVNSDELVRLLTRMMRNRGKG